MTCSPQPGRRIDVSIDPSFQGEVSEPWLVDVMAEALSVALPGDVPCQVGLVIADDATLQSLNQQFRGLNEVTDVLSFSGSVPGTREGEAESPPFVLPPGEPPPLGEVVISYPQARRQALARGEPVNRELALLIAHGVLHLVGHDHLGPEEAAGMQAKEDAALEAIFQPRTHI